MKRTILAIFAHPDDEAFGTGGTLARYAAEGHDVYLVTATRGEAGQIADPTLATSANLPLVRENELRCACRTYGIHEPIFLDYQDGQMAVAHQGQAVAKLVRIIRQLKPDVIIAFGPDGVYGHYDHIAAHRWAVIAAELSADPDCFPDLDVCDPHRVSKIYYRELTTEQVQSMSEDGRSPAVMMDGVPFRFQGLPLSQITTIVNVSAYMDAKLAGIRCHRTQLSPDMDIAENVQEALQDPWFAKECYVLAQSLMDRPEGIEDDLLAGLPD